jgi:hypothetical protein
MLLSGLSLMRYYQKSMTQVQELGTLTTLSSLLVSEFQLSNSCGTYLPSQFNAGIDPSNPTVGTSAHPIRMTLLNSPYPTLPSTLTTAYIRINGDFIKNSLPTTPTYIDGDAYYLNLIITDRSCALSATLPCYGTLQLEMDRPGSLGNPVPGITTANVKIGYPNSGYRPY